MYFKVNEVMTAWCRNLTQKNNQEYFFCTLKTKLYFPDVSGFFNFSVGRPSLRQNTLNSFNSILIITIGDLQHNIFFTISGGEQNRKIHNTAEGLTVKVFLSGVNWQVFFPGNNFIFRLFRYKLLSGDHTEWSFVDY